MWGLDGSIIWKKPVNTSKHQRMDNIKGLVEVFQFRRNIARPQMELDGEEWFLRLWALEPGMAWCGVAIDWVNEMYKRDWFDCYTPVRCDLINSKIYVDVVFKKRYKIYSDTPLVPLNYLKDIWLLKIWLLVWF